MAGAGVAPFLTYTRWGTSLLLGLGVALVELALEPHQVAVLHGRGHALVVGHGGAQYLPIAPQTWSKATPLSDRNLVQRDGLLGGAPYPVGLELQRQLVLQELEQLLEVAPEQELAALDGQRASEQGDRPKLESNVKPFAGGNRERVLPTF